MATVTIRVPDELKRRMEEANVNWSDLLRDAIEERLRRMHREQAARRMDELREDVFRRSGGKHTNATKEIRKWRDLR